METAQRFFMKSALVLTAATAMTGCVEEKITPIDYGNLKFVVNVASPNDNGTRALKDGWANGDKIVAFFDADATKYVTFTYNETTSGWDSDDASVDGIAVSGNLQAVHAGTENFGFSGGNLINIGGDLLYDKEGAFTVDAGTQTAYLTLEMDRGFTTAIKMQGSIDEATNEKWRLAGENLWVMDPAKGTSLTAADITTNPDWALQKLFSLSNVAGAVAVPDALFTDDTQAVFHVWDQDGANADRTSFSVYSTDATGTVYTRDYSKDLTAGATVLIAGPDSAEESTQWTEQVAPNLVTDGTVELTGVTAPAAGGTPAATVAETSDQFDAAIAWDPADNTFAAGTAYTATVTLTATSGNTFTGGFGDTASVAGFTVNGTTPTWVSNDGGTLVLSYTFAATAALATPAALTVTAPEAGATPAATVAETSDQFDAAIAWDPAAATFAQGTAYTATITLTATDGNTFATGYGDTAAITGFTVNGAAPTWVSNDGATLVFTCTFDETSANNITYVPGGADDNWKVQQ